MSPAHSDPYPTLLWTMILFGACAKGNEMVALQQALDQQIH